MTARDDDRSARQIARGKQRKAGDRSARLANELMKLPAPAVKKLELEEDLRDAIGRARAVTSMIARRRAERTLAGELRRFDLVAVAGQLARVHESANADARPLHLAEQWRARLLDEGPAAIALFPGGGDDQLPRLIDAAQRERATGRPPGAARSLFRHLVTLLKAQDATAADAESDAETDAETDDDA